MTKNQARDFLDRYPIEEANKKCSFPICANSNGETGILIKNNRVSREILVGRFHEHISIFGKATRLPIAAEQR
jgi:hypothetical protein